MAAHKVILTIEGKKAEATLSSDGVLRWPGGALDILNEVGSHNAQRDYTILLGRFSKGDCISVDQAESIWASQAPTYAFPGSAHCPPLQMQSTSDGTNHLQNLQREIQKNN